MESPCSIRSGCVREGWGNYTNKRDLQSPLDQADWVVFGFLEWLANGGFLFKLSVLMIGLFCQREMKVVMNWRARK